MLKRMLPTRNAGSRTAQMHVKIHAAIRAEIYAEMHATIPGELSLLALSLFFSSTE